MSRDRIVCGISNVQTQKQLLVEKDLTFAKAKEIVLGLESAVQGARDIQLPSSGTVNTVVEKKTTSYNKCFRYGRTNHSAPQCRYRCTRMPYARSVTRLATWPKFARVRKLFLVPVYQQRNGCRQMLFLSNQAIVKSMSMHYSPSKTLKR